MNWDLDKNKFRHGLEELLETIKREQMRPAINPYAGTGDQSLHEHDTRIIFFDELLKLLGWKLGVGGDIVEEARIKAETTRFIDYLGVNPDSGTPFLIFEAKAWDKPIISGKGEWGRADRSELVIAAVRHLHNGGGKEDSPVTDEWHEYLSQLRGYVRTSKNRYGHSVPRAVLSSGRWLLIFNAPADAFCDGKIGYDQFLLLEYEHYVAEAHKIFVHLARDVLAPSPPERIRSTQLPNYVAQANYKAAYCAVLIRYEKTGVRIFATSPRILLYPALLIELKNGMMYTVIDSELPIEPLLRSNDEDGELTRHFVAFEAGALRLLESCSMALGFALDASSLIQFPGFNVEPLVVANEIALNVAHKKIIRDIGKDSDQWLAAVGENRHILSTTPRIACRFHEWSTCRAAGCAIGNSAINVPTTDSPRSFFIDASSHHCANQAIIDRRHDRCHLALIDSRACCKACAYHDLCWPADEASALPCGA